MNELFVAGGFSTTRYQAELLKLQLELCHVQEWAALSRERAIVALEGRSGAGKGRIARALTAKVSPNILRRVHLPKRTEREDAQFFMQRYAPHFPAYGEIVVSARPGIGKRRQSSCWVFAPTSSTVTFSRPVPSPKNT